MKISWISHACFKIETSKGVIIYTDPYKISSEQDKADLIIVSHSHFDHMERKSIKAVQKEDTKIVGPNSIFKDLEKYNGEGLELGKRYTFFGVTIKLVPAYTVQKSTHPQANQWAGYIIKADNKKVYHAGDTELIPEMKELQSENIDVALLPCGGTYTMDFQESISAALDIKPKIVIPMHNWDKDLTEFKTMLNQKDASIAVEILTDKTLEL
ncbi:MAG: hypothetical protein BAJALOKI1v1_380018 [Promethearchaeota archaeon]|nr:MAG: hypothetical protein BAJALOKI1v1_380018 [Candidatus Lokiarchaeota archaeon]